MEGRFSCKARGYVVEIEFISLLIPLALSKPGTLEEAPETERDQDLVQPAIGKPPFTLHLPQGT
jgi:hypothetical protein